MIDLSCDNFYRERDARTGEYLGTLLGAQKTVAVHVGTSAASSLVGQHLVLALTNLLARVHRRIHFALPIEPHPLLAPTLTADTVFQDAVLNLARLIDPCGVFTFGSGSRDINIGVEPNDATGCQWYLGADCSIASLATEPISVSTVTGTMRGAGLAACLGAAAALKAELGLEVSPRRVSAWNYGEGSEAARGPVTLQPVNVGRVLMVGAGAVASAVTYWLWQWGVAGQWTVVDADVVKLHNTNRGLLFVPRDAGWPAGVQRPKADVLTNFLRGGHGVPQWYDEATSITDTKFDVVLSLANERNIRHLLSHRNATVTLQATTGRNWLSQLHRHVAGTDDCPSCRLDEVIEPRFSCGTGPTNFTAAEEKNDSALPFLSAASGLMLATMLQRLEAGVLMETSRNNWRWDFLSAHRMASGGHSRCLESCRNWYSSTVRRRVNIGTRWSHLDS